MTPIEQQIALLRDAMKLRAGDTYQTDNYPLWKGYIDAADSASRLLRDLAELREAGGNV
ncbi:hypothetical protein [Pseudomonas sp.]|uniref:hypothetical protein n=1 Tax=Pseudomonas sp. TaxID=306 RepID=UPI0025895392|nr:hypothetical protein [Pseudomonas sp.]